MHVNSHALWPHFPPSLSITVLTFRSLQLFLTSSITGSASIDFEEDEPALKTVKVKPVPLSAKIVGRGCPKCGSPSRHKKDCSRSANAEAKPAKQRMPGQGCPECGSKSRHRKECSHAGNKAWKDLGKVSGAKPGMSQMQFGRVKIALSHDIPSEVIARDMVLSEGDVLKASEAVTYDEYKAL